MYWWAPGVTDWSVTPLLPDTVSPDALPTGKLTSSSSAAGTLNVFGASDRGDVIRMSWRPGETDAGWTAENLTAMAERM